MVDVTICRSTFKTYEIKHASNKEGQTVYLRVCLCDRVYVCAGAVGDETFCVSIPGFSFKSTHKHNTKKT